MHSDSAGAHTAGGPHGTMTGEIVFDLDAGRAVRATTQLTAELPSPQGGTMPMRTRSTTEMLP